MTLSRFTKKDGIVEVRNGQALIASFDGNMIGREAASEAADAFIAAYRNRLKRFVVQDTHASWDITDTKHPDGGDALVATFWKDRGLNHPQYCAEQYAESLNRMAEDADSLGEVG